MARAVRDLPPATRGLLDIHEWTLETLEGVARIRTLKPPRLPAIAVNGQVAFAGLIPDQGELEHFFRNLVDH